MQNYISFFLALCILIVSCTNKIGKNKTCIYTYNKDGDKDGSYTCFYKNGKIRRKGFMRQDSLNVDEEYIFYNNEILKEYNFYDPEGCVRYNRTYDLKGDLINEQGDFFCYQIIDKFESKVGDSLYFQIFIANPPGTYFNVYGINDSGMYPIKMISTGFSFTQKRFLHIKRKGSFRLPIAVEFVDSINNKKEIRKRDIDFYGI